MSADKCEIILASASPRRAELLFALGLDFTTRPVEVDETPLHSESPVSLALRLAQEKTGLVRREENQVVIGCDTIVVIGGRILGKPENLSDAYEMLNTLNGKRHQVISGVALRGQELVSDFCSTEVSFANLSEQAIRWYLESGEAMDKAGAYGIQGLAGLFVTEIKGSYSNVVGLPLHLLPPLFEKLGVDFYALLSRLDK